MKHLLRKLPRRLRSVPMRVDALSLETKAIHGKKLLVVDDVADSGRTLALVMEMMSGMGAMIIDARVVPRQAWRSHER